MSKFKKSFLFSGLLVLVAAAVVYALAIHNPKPAPTKQSTAKAQQTHPPVTADAPCGWLAHPPKPYKHIVWIWEENKDESDVVGAAPYIDSLAQKCASETNIMDNGTTASLISEPQYAAATSGSNCNQGVTSASGPGTGCILDDADYGPANSLTTESIFQLVKANGGSWKSYQESMPANCAEVSTKPYAFKHNPAAFYSQITGDCAKYDVPFPAIDCPTTGSAVCSTPSGALADDIAGGKLATFTFITPNLINDMHDGTVAQGDNWLKTYLPLFIAGPNYQAGDTAIFIMWDEGSTTTGTPIIPSLVVAPSVKPGTAVKTAANNVGLLKTTQDALRLKPYLGCASGTAPGSTGTCSQQSSVSLAKELNLQ